MLSVVQAQPLAPILRQIVDGVTEASDVALARLWVLESDRECLVCSGSPVAKGSQRVLHLLASSGKSLATGELYTGVAGKAHRIELGERKIGCIAQNREALLISDVTPSQDWVADPEWVEREKIRSFAGHPLICRDELLGVLAVFSRTKFSDEDFQWLRTFADHAAVAIWNARSFDELNRLRTQLELENEYLSDEIKQTIHFGDIVTQSKSFQKVLQQVQLVAETTATVLIFGESGTGKELIARAIHERGPRKSRPFIKVNCGAIPETLFESEFFGHVKGAFTGALSDRIGRFELAQGGDLFLDEVGEIPMSLQAKLLRVLQEKQFERVGDARTRCADVRILAATNRNLKEEVEAGNFREDLYYRLTVFPIEIPPLRDRKEDIAPMALQFIRKSAARLKIKAPRLNTRQLRELEGYDWPGNVRELENVLERAVILARESGDLKFELQRPRVALKNPSHPVGTVKSPSFPPSILSWDELKKREVDNILAALRQSNGRVFGRGGAAESLGMKPTTLASKLKALGIEKRFISGPNRSDS
ncbi:MAG: Transcriptional regulator, NifA subfamily, Fis Family [Verrucomicrobiales bacterium]|nr:Transcriptional regulator, NifA subfamily, Fis Family [Verrucomicrobiales bacterium]